MKLKLLLEIIENIKTNSAIKAEVEEDIILYIREYIASTITEHEVKLLKGFDGEFEVDLHLISWLLFDDESNRNQIFANLKSEIFEQNKGESIDYFDKIIDSNRKKNPLEDIPMIFYKSVSTYIKNREIKDNKLDYAIRFLKNISWKYSSYSELSDKQANYLNQLIKDYPDFFNNDFLKEKGFSNECEIISGL